MSEELKPTRYEFTSPTWCGGRLSADCDETPDGDYVKLEDVQSAIDYWNQRTEQPAPTAVPAECGACHGSGRMVRDPGIGTDQECFSCDGSGVDEDAAVPAAVSEGEATWPNKSIEKLAIDALWNIANYRIDIGPQLTAQSMRFTAADSLTMIHELRAALRSQPAPTEAPKWTQQPPSVQADYWHWNGNEDAAPFVISVMYSGTARKCFVSTPHTDSGGWAEWCDTYGGWWMRIEQPSLPGEDAPTEAQGEMMESSDVDVLPGYTKWMHDSSKFPHADDKRHPFDAFKAGAAWAAQGAQSSGNSGELVQGEDSARLDAERLPSMNPACGCQACNPQMIGRMMFICNLCGDKRCPHVANHVKPCQGRADAGSKP